jgi:hypothetical protein
MRLARFPLTMTKYLDYHHVYSYVVASKNFFTPRTLQQLRTHGLAHDTDNKGKLFVMLFA